MNNSIWDPDPIHDLDFDEGRGDGTNKISSATSSFDDVGNLGMNGNRTSGNNTCSSSSTTVPFNYSTNHQTTNNYDLRYKGSSSQNSRTMNINHYPYDDNGNNNSMIPALQELGEQAYNTNHHDHRRAPVNNQEIDVIGNEINHQIHIPVKNYDQEVSQSNHHHSGMFPSSSVSSIGSSIHSSHNNNNNNSSSNFTNNKNNLHDTSAQKCTSELISTPLIAQVRF